MITEIPATFFLCLVFGLFWYIFRGLNYDENPIWGNVLASGMNIVFCGLFAIWFYQGNIVIPSVDIADQYMIPQISTLSAADAYNVSYNLYKIGEGGSGMYVVSATDAHGNGSYLQNVTGSYFHHEIYYIQLQDVALSFVFTALAIVSGFLFSWFAWNARLIMKEVEAYDAEHPEDEGIS